MSESLKEKAKSASEIQNYTVQFFDKIRNAENPERAREEWMAICDKKEWVRLEDAQRELDNLRWNLQRTIISLQKELKELKEGKQSG
jgi:hypothetical protein